MNARFVCYESECVYFFQDSIASLMNYGVIAKINALMSTFNKYATSQMRLWFYGEHKMSRYESFFVTRPKYFTYDEKTGVIGVNVVKGMLGEDAKWPSDEDAKTSTSKETSKEEESGDSAKKSKYSKVTTSKLKELAQRMREKKTEERAEDTQSDKDSTDTEEIKDFTSKRKMTKVLLSLRDRRRNEALRNSNQLVVINEEDVYVSAEEECPLIEVPVEIDEFHDSIAAKVTAVQCVHFVFNHLRGKKEKYVQIAELRTELHKNHPNFLMFIIQSCAKDKTDPLIVFFKRYEEVFEVRNSRLAIKKMDLKKLNQFESIINKEIENCLKSLLIDFLSDREYSSESTVENHISNTQSYLTSVISSISEFANQFPDVFIVFKWNSETCLYLIRETILSKRRDALYLSNNYGRRLNLSGTVVDVRKHVAFICITFVDFHESCNCCYCVTATTDVTTILDEKVDDLSVHLKNGDKVKFTAMYCKENVGTPKNLWYACDVNFINAFHIDVLSPNCDSATESCNDCQCNQSMDKFRDAFSAIVDHLDYVHLNCALETLATYVKQDDVSRQTQDNTF